MMEEDSGFKISLMPLHYYVFGIKIGRLIYTFFQYFTVVSVCISALPWRSAEYASQKEFRYPGHNFDE